MQATSVIAIRPPQKKQNSQGQAKKKEVVQRPGARKEVSSMLPPEVSALLPLSVVLGRPTNQEITLNLLARNSLEAYVEYGVETGKYGMRSRTVSLTADTPVEIALDGLEPDSAYSYRLNSRKPGDKDFMPGEEHRFQTQRAPGRPFVFEVQGDSHPERPKEYNPALYAQMLRSAAADHPDFYLCMGDDFSVDTLRRVIPDAVAEIYRSQRLFLGLLGSTAPLFLVNGNHEQAAMANLDHIANNIAVWAQTNRNRFFPQPAPDAFYTGDAQPVPNIGPLRDYYAWTWGDALFVVVDFYWHSSVPVDNVFGGGTKTNDRWLITLGREQYEWLKRTLEQSKAKYKFVFTHHVLGTGRGGIELAGFNEWGGHDRKGTDSFAMKRPGWESPIHRLFVENRVTIFFQGHDHIFVRQQLDGVVYQTLPEPADPNYALFNRDAYHSGNALPNSGRLRVTVSPEKVAVDYLRSYLPKDATPLRPDGEIAFHYEIPATQKAP
jgi:hypothetical protein